MPWWQQAMQAAQQEACAAADCPAPASCSPAAASPSQHPVSSTSVGAASHGWQPGACHAAQALVHISISISTTTTSMQVAEWVDGQASSSGCCALPLGCSVAAACVTSRQMAGMLIYSSKCSRPTAWCPGPTPAHTCCASAPDMWAPLQEPTSRLQATSQQQCLAGLPPRHHPHHHPHHHRLCRLAPAPALACRAACCGSVTSSTSVALPCLLLHAARPRHTPQVMPAARRCMLQRLHVCPQTGHCLCTQLSQQKPQL